MIRVAIGVLIGQHIGAVIGGTAGAGAVADPSFYAAGAPQAGVGAVTVPWPPGHALNDIGLLLLVVPSGAASLATANGFVEIADSPQTCSAAATTVKLAAFICRATSGGMSAPITNAPDDSIRGVILTFRDCLSIGDAVDAIDVTAGSVNVANATAVTIPGDTTTGDRELVVAICAQGVDASFNDFTGWTNASLESITEILDISTTLGAGGGLGVACGIKAEAGAYSNTTATLQTTSGQARISLALKPEAE